MRDDFGWIKCALLVNLGRVGVSSARLQTDIARVHKGGEDGSIDAVVILSCWAVDDLLAREAKRYGLVSNGLEWLNRINNREHPVRIAEKSVLDFWHLVELPPVKAGWWRLLSEVYFGNDDLEEIISAF